MMQIDLNTGRGEDLLNKLNFCCVDKRAFWKVFSSLHWALGAPAADALGVCSVPVKQRLGEASHRVPTHPGVETQDVRLPPSAAQDGPSPTTVSTSWTRRRPSLCPSSRHLRCCHLILFKLTWAVISAGYPVSKELNSLQLFSACRPLLEAVRICKSLCLKRALMGVFPLPLSKSKRECSSLALNTRGKGRVIQVLPLNRLFRTDLYNEVEC